MTPNEFYHFRESLEMTQKELAKIFDVSISTIRNYENGRSEIPLSIEFILKWDDQSLINNLILFKSTKKYEGIK
tara:strand:- start:1183 stop:1404 length:222 start_codon:yes stop_codon:yes gene_type:complete